MAAALDLAIRAMVLLSLAALVTAALRRRPASLSALVWTLALAGLLLLPAFAFITPDWRVEVLPARAEAGYPAASRPAGDVVHIAPSPGADLAPVARRHVVDGAPAERVAAVAQPGAVAAGSPFDWRVAAAALVLLVSTLLLARIALSHARMAGIAASAAPAPAAWRALAAGVRLAMRIPGDVPVRVSAAIGVPAVVGVFRPVLLLPADADDWDADTRRAVVLHELAHVARRDALSQLVSQIACAIYWCLPLVWHAARRAAALRERASDDHVLRSGIRASAYAESLLVLARVARGGDMQAAALSMARPSRMRERVVAILDPRVRRDAPARATIGATIAASICAVALLAAIQPAAAAAIAPVRETVAASPAPSEPGVTVATSAPSPAAKSAVPAEPVEPVEPAERAALDQTPRPCSGEFEQHVTSTNTDAKGRSMKLEMSRPGCKIDARTEGRLEFNADFTDITSVGSGGFFRVDVTDNGVRRQLEITQSGGSLARKWRVDGREQPYDQAARAWFTALLIELDRKTAIGVDVRLPHLMRQGGVDAVLAETALMTGDHARGVYYTRLAKAATLSTPQITGILDQAARLTASDHYAHALIEAFAGKGVSDDAQRAAIAKLIDTMDSDHYRAASVEALVGAPPISASEVDFLVRMIPKMDSDHYQLQVLSKVMKAGQLTPPQQALLTDATASIESDHYAAEFLKILAGAGPMAPPVRRAFATAVGRIESDHYAAEVLKTLIAKQSPSSSDIPAILALTRGIESDHNQQEVLRALLARGKLTDTDLLGVVDIARSMSDHYASETLRRVVHANMSAPLRAAVLDAAGGLSKHYAEQVRRAAGER